MTHHQVMDPAQVQAAVRARGTKFTTAETVYQ